MEEIVITLHDGHMMRIREWHPEGGGLLLIIDNKETMAGNDADSRRYIVERILKSVRDDTDRLLNPDEG